MKLPSFRRIVKESLPEEFRPLADSIGESINSFAETMSNAMANNINVDDNLNMQYKTIEVMLDATNRPVNNTQYKSTIHGKTRGIVVIKVDNLTNPSRYPTAAPFITFSEENNIITIKHITGLTPSNKYSITLLATG